MHVVLLDAEYDLRRYPFAHETPASLMPVLDRPLLGRTVEWLRRAGAGEISFVSARNAAADFELARAIVRYQLRPVGSLGEALERARRELRIDEPLIVLNANLHCLPDFTSLMSQHLMQRNALTYVRGASIQGPGRYTFGPPVLAVASPVVSRMMRLDDQKLPLPVMLKAVRKRGLEMASFDAPQNVVSIDNSYALYHANLDGITPEFLLRAGNEMQLERRAERLWVAPGAHLGKVHVDPTGGPVIVGRGARIADGAILRGPTIVGQNAIVHRGSCVHRSLVLGGSRVPKESWVANSVVSRRIRERIAA